MCNLSPLGESLIPMDHLSHQDPSENASRLYRKAYSVALVNTANVRPRMCIRGGS